MAVNVQPKPTAAFAAALIAGLTTILFALLYPSSPLQLITGPTLTTMVQIWGTLAGILTIVGAWLLYNNAAQRKLGSILTLVFSLISMNILGLIIGLIGGFLGYTYKTSTTGTSSNTGRTYNPP
jgi:uncharacterized membrane protein